ncbi:MULTISPECIES: hypothetical protein [Sphingomonas]|uniref:hypothetical protein n=1 Tax=Sphingomonas TaxID=13687 RepID=UPI0012EDC83B|nr:MULTISPECIES: hypothetical protein [Sphingomonas]
MKYIAVFRIQDGRFWDLPAIQKRTKNGGFRQERTIDNLPMSSPETSKIWSIAVQKHAAEQREKLMSIFQFSFRNAPLIQVEFHPNPFSKEKERTESGIMPSARIRMNRSFSFLPVVRSVPHAKSLFTRIKIGINPAGVAGDTADAFFAMVDALHCGFRLTGVYAGRAAASA